VKLLVINRIPRRIRNIAPIVDTHLRYIEIFLIYSVAFDSPSATNKNGIARPAENTDKRSPP